MKKIRILILGSCVSRDALNFDSDNQFEIVDYYARSSFASAFSETPMDDIYTHNLESRFQANVVKADLEKTLAGQLSSLDFDLLLIDLIDERFKLALNEAGAICTVSNELVAAGFDVQQAPQIIEPNSPEFYSAWVKGWERFITLMRAMGCNSKIIINKTFWAESTAAGGDFSEHFKPVHIERANRGLQKLYDRIALDLSANQFIEHSRTEILGADEHRWGLSPFHYVDQYYVTMLSKIREKFFNKTHTPIETPATKPALECLSDRDIIDYRVFCNIASDSEETLSLKNFSGNAKVAVLGNNPLFTISGKGGVYQIRFKMPTRFYGNGLSIRFKISDWKKLNYIGIGYTHENTYRHVKIVNAARDQWIDFSIGQHDLAYGIQNDWQSPSACDFQEIKLYFKGEPAAEGSTVEIEKLISWRERESPADWQVTHYQAKALPTPLLDSLYDYMEKCFKNAIGQADAFMQNGTCPLYGDVTLEWQPDHTLPADLDAVGTYRFSWHALHPAMVLMIKARKQNSMAPLFAARELVSNWLERSFYTADEDRKFAWYDHGTAERLLAFLMMWEVGAQYKFDTRFMNRLRLAIFKHAQLLASEMFYASHQSSRYHNHAWFQDMALLATSLALPDFPCAERWQALAVERLSDQLEKLIIRDNGYAVFVENSIGYHQGVQRLISFAGQLAQQSSHQTVIPSVAEELQKFSDFLRYPDNRSPAQGDTFRRPNPDIASVRRSPNFAKPAATILQKAGYAIIKGNHTDTGYMFSMFATSLCKTHKHEDNLSFTLFLDGIEWLIDPSFYSHEYHKPLQSFLRSANAHNNPIISDTSYSIEPGSSQFTAETDDSNFIISGSHTAYANCIISRRVEGSLNELQLEITDHVDVDQADKHIFSLFHCGDGVEVTDTAGGIMLEHSASPFKIKILSDSPYKIITGWNPDRFHNGASGLGFMQNISTSMIAFELKDSENAKFQITATQN